MLIFVVDLSDIPKNVERWNFDTINSLSNITNLESDKIECKREMNDDLAKHICAMSNTSGGFIIIGLDQKNHGFDKIGLSDTTEDKIMLHIGNAQVCIDPIPKISINCIEKEGKLYPIIQTHEESSKKPFFVRNTGVCHIRIGNSTRPAPRDTIMKLFSSLDLKKEIKYLRASVLMVKDSLVDNIGYIGSISTKDVTCPSTIDVSFFKDAVMRNQSFLIENDLYGEITEHSRRIGVVTLLQTLDKLNMQIKAYSLSQDVDTKKKIKYLVTDERSSLKSDISEISGLIDELVSKCDKHIESYD